MGSRCRTWVVLADRVRLCILQATDGRAGFDEILRRNGGTAGLAATGRRSGRASPADRRFETCAAHILNHAAILELYDALVLVGPPPSLRRLTQDLNAPARGRLLAAVPADLLDLPEPVLLTRLRTLLNACPGVGRD